MKNCYNEKSGGVIGISASDSNNFIITGLTSEFAKLNYDTKVFSSKSEMNDYV